MGGGRGLGSSEPSGPTLDPSTISEESVGLHQKGLMVLKRLSLQL